MGSKGALFEPIEEVEPGFVIILWYRLLIIHFINLPVPFSSSPLPQEPPLPRPRDAAAPAGQLRVGVRGGVGAEEEGPHQGRLRRRKKNILARAQATSKKLLKSDKGTFMDTIY